MAAAKPKGSVYLRAALWVVIIVALMGGSIFFLAGLVSLLGYQGTTSLRSLEADSTEWKNFSNLFKEKKGAPFFWTSGEPRIENNRVIFDKRLVRELTYLSRKSDKKCGWDGQHEKIGLLERDMTDSDLSYLPTNTQSNSTLGRGVGIRIASVDEIKCTIYPVDPVNCEYKDARIFASYQISLAQSDVLSADIPYNNGACKVECAVDYYPRYPVDAPGDQTSQPNEIAELSRYNPGVFDYQTIANNGKKAALYKAAQIMYEVLRTDNPNCEVASGNVGNKRNIPTTLIVPQWIMSRLGNDWQSFLDLAQKNFPYGLQTNSPLAGLSYDVLLNEQGIHLNY